MFVAPNIHGTSSVAHSNCARSPRKSAKGSSRVSPSGRKTNSQRGSQMSQVNRSSQFNLPHSKMSARHERRDGKSPDCETLNMGAVSLPSDEASKSALNKLNSGLPRTRVQVGTDNDYSAIHYSNTTDGRILASTHFVPPPPQLEHPTSPNIGENSVPISDGVNFAIMKKGTEQIARVPVEKATQPQNKGVFSLSPTADGRGGKLEVTVDSLRNSMDQN